MVGIDIEAVRRDTPGCRQRIHFNNAGASLVPLPVLRTIIDHLNLESQIGGYEAAEAASDRISAVYDSAARLLNCAPDEIALVENATRAWDAVFYSIPFHSGDRIVTGCSEYCSNYMALLQIARKTGVEIVVVGDDDSGQIDLEQLSDVVDERVKLVALTHVPTSGGLVNPAVEVGAIARQAGALYLLDACQSAGQMPIDVRVIGCDFLSTTGRKFLRGPRGTGVLFVDRERIDRLEPAIVEVGSARWTEKNAFTWRPGAKRFQTWEVSYALQLGLGRAIDYALDLGLASIWDRIRELANALRQCLEAIDGVRVHDIGVTKCGIITFTVPGINSDAAADFLQLKGVNVDVSTIEDSRLDFEARGLPSLVRASVHYFNTLEEVLRFSAHIGSLSAAHIH